MTAPGIVYSCHDAFPSTDTNTQQIFWTLLEMARLGHEVRLLVPAVTAPRDAVAAHYGVSGGELPASLHIEAAGRGRPTGTVARGWFDWTIARRLKRSAADFVWTRDPVAAASSLRAGLRTVFETYRPDLATAPAFWPWRRACLGSTTLAGLISHSQLTHDAFLAAGVARDRSLIAHNGYAPSLMDPVLTREDARVRTGLPLAARLVVYTGHVGPAKGMDALVAVAARVPAAQFVVVGVDAETKERAWLLDLARKSGANNLVLVPRVPIASVAAYLYAADCLIIPPTDEPLRKYRRTVLPMKVFSYLAAGRPILAPALPDLEEVLADGETARLVPPSDPAAAAAALSQLLADEGLQRTLSEGASRASRAFTWSARARKISSFLQAQSPGPKAQGLD